jgi:hypothetical protein
MTILADAGLTAKARSALIFLSSRFPMQGGETYEPYFCPAAFLVAENSLNFLRHLPESLRA